MEKLLLSPAEVHERFGLEPGTLSNWRSLGRGPRFVKYGNRVAYRLEDLKAWVESHSFRTTAEAKRARCVDQNFEAAP